jgi:hypothetical protein
MHSEATESLPTESGKKPEGQPRTLAILLVDLDVPAGAAAAVEAALPRQAQLLRFTTEPGGVAVGAVRSVLVANATGAEFIAALKALKGGTP